MFAEYFAAYNITMVVDFKDTLCSETYSFNFVYFTSLVSLLVLSTIQGLS